MAAIATTGDHGFRRRDLVLLVVVTRCFVVVATVVVLARPGLRSILGMLMFTMNM